MLEMPKQQQCLSLTKNLWEMISFYFKLYLHNSNHTCITWNFNWLYNTIRGLSLYLMQSMVLNFRRKIIIKVAKIKVSLHLQGKETKLHKYHYIKRKRNFVSKGPHWYELGEIAMPGPRERVRNKERFYRESDIWDSHCKTTFFPQAKLGQEGFLGKRKRLVKSLEIGKYGV